MLSAEKLHLALEHAIGVGTIANEEKLHSYGFNSLMFMEVICSIEEKYDVDVDLSMLESIGDHTTMEELVALIVHAAR